MLNYRWRTYAESDNIAVCPDSSTGLLKWFGVMGRNDDNEYDFHLTARVRGNPAGSRFLIEASQNGQKFRAVLNEAGFVLLFPVFPFSGNWIASFKLRETVRKHCISCCSHTLGAL